MRLSMIFTAVIAVLAASLSMPGFVFAATPVDDEMDDEMIVTATLDGQSVRDLPASVTVLDGRTLEDAGVEHFQDVLGLIPNLNYALGSSRPRYFQLRGVGEDEQFEGAPNSSVGFLIDEIDFSGIGMPANLFDVEQIEVLRGPQGATYGANALGGLISVRTRDPQLTPEFKLQTVAGDYGVLGYGGLVGGAIGESDAAFRVVAQRYRGDGFRRNTFLGRDDTNGYDESLVRGKLRWNAGENLSVDFTAMFADLDNGYDAFSLDNSRVTLSDKPGRDAQRSAAVAARLEYTGFERFTLRSTSTAADSDILYSFDGDWGNAVSWGVDGPYDYTSRFDRERHTWSQDLRLLSNTAAGARSSWVAGVYALNLRETNDQLDLYNGDVYIALDSLFESTSLALYGQYSFAVTDKLTLTAGARTERRQADYSDSAAVSFNPTETMLGGHVSLAYAFAQDSTAYATLSRGYKAGGFNVSAGITDESRKQFDAEYLWNLETGLKTRDATGRFEAQGAVFYMRRMDQQVDTSVQQGLSFIFFKDNAARGENYGVESTLIYRPIPQLELSGGVGLLKTRYLGYVYGDRNLNGREQVHAPEYQISFGAQYRHPRGFLARVDTQSVDDFYYSASHDERSPAYTLVHIKTGYETERWSAMAWVRNVFDENYSMRGFFFANDPPNFTNEQRYTQAGDPRQIGITATWSWR